MRRDDSLWQQERTRGTIDEAKVVSGSQVVRVRLFVEANTIGAFQHGCRQWPLNFVVAHVRECAIKLCIVT